MHCTINSVSDEKILWKSFNKKRKKKKKRIMEMCFIDVILFRNFFYKGQKNSLL